MTCINEKNLNQILCHIFESGADIICEGQNKSTESKAMQKNIKCPTISEKRKQFVTLHTKTTCCFNGPHKNDQPYTVSFQLLIQEVMSSKSRNSLTETSSLQASQMFTKQRKICEKKFKVHQDLEKLGPKRTETVNQA